MMDNFAFLLPIMMGIFGCVFLELFRRGMREAGYWSTGYLLAAAGFSMPLAAGHAPTELVGMIADVLFLGAFYFYGAALLLRFRQPPLVALRLALGLISFGMTLCSVFGLQSIAADLVSNDFGCLVLLASALVPSWRAAVHLADRLLLTVATLIAAETLLRNIAFVVMAPAYGDVQTFFESPYAFVMQAGAAVLALLLGLSSIAAVTVDLIMSYRDSAERDPLTDLLNRRGFERIVNQQSAAASASSALIVCDLDHFKRVNDTFGHAAGDAVLVLFADEIRRCLPRTGTAARFGGEEFVIHLPQTTLSEAAHFANELRLAFTRADLSKAGLTAPVTATFGVAESRHGDIGTHSQLGRADVALYAAKAAGRNRIMLAGDPPKEFSVVRLTSSRIA